ncbi:MAG: alpha/beta hydrolase-fold protein [Polyangiaceae bacterium]
MQLRVRKEVFGWHSPRLGMHMPIVRYGHWGRPVLLFPTAGSDLFDVERFLLIHAIQQHIEAGRITVFSIDTVNTLSWMDKHVGPRESGRRQALYASYVEEEVVPHIRRVLENDSARIMVTGASFGAFHAANMFFRRPDLFDTLVAMSGFYDLSPSFTKGYSDDNIYFNNPSWFVPKITDSRMLDLIKHHSQIHILSGQGAYEAPDASRRFSRILWEKGIWHNLDLWGHDMPHDWPTWRKMLDHYVDARLGF